MNTIYHNNNIGRCQTQALFDLKCDRPNKEMDGQIVKLLKLVKWLSITFIPAHVREVVLYGIRNNGIADWNKQISTLTIFHYRRLYCIILQVASIVFPC